MNFPLTSVLQWLEQLNRIIDIGLNQLDAGKGLKADEVYHRLNQKIATYPKIKEKS